MTVQATRGVGSRTYQRPRRVLLTEPPNSLFVGFNATVIVEPLGLEYLAGNLLDIADVRIYDMRVDRTPLAQVIEEFKPDVVGIREGYTVDVSSVKDLARDIKKISSDIIIIVGGHHVSLAPQDAFSPDIDAIVIGDGENTFRRLVLSLQNDRGLDSIPEVIYRTASGDFDQSNTKVIKKSSLKEFDSLSMNERPLPARHLVDQYREDYFFLYHTRPIP